MQQQQEGRCRSHVCTSAAAGLSLPGCFRCAPAWWLQGLPPPPAARGRPRRGPPPPPGPAGCPRPGGGGGKEARCSAAGRDCVKCEKQLAQPGLGREGQSGDTLGFSALGLEHQLFGAAGAKQMRFSALGRCRTLSRASLSAPAASSLLAASQPPAAAAQCSGERPAPSSASLAAPASSSTRTATPWPHVAPAAQCSGVEPSCGDGGGGGRAEAPAHPAAPRVKGRHMQAPITASPPRHESVGPAGQGKLQGRLASS